MLVIKKNIQKKMKLQRLALQLLEKMNPENTHHLQNYEKQGDNLKWTPEWGAWMAQSVKHLISAQVMISRFVGSSPASGSVLTAGSLEPALDSVSPSLSAPLLLVLCLSLSLSKINIKKNFFKFLL